MAAIRRLFVTREPSDKERKNLAILDTIRRRGPIARTEISRITGFNIVTVSNYIDHYIKQGLVSEGGYNASSGGRKPMLIDLNYKSAYAIGVGFDLNNMLGVLINLRGDILLEVRKKRPSVRGKELIDNLMYVIDELLEKYSHKREKIKGIGLAVAGVIDSANRTVRWPGPLGTEDIIVSASLWDTFENRFDTPIIIENDADCAAFGEQWITLDRDLKNVIYMYSGVACGIMINGQIYKGASTGAGELGIINLQALNKYDWKKESYGLGRWDVTLGMLNDIKELQKEYADSKIFKLVNNKPEDVNFLTVVEAANSNDELAVKLLTKAGGDLGKKVAFLVNLLNPQVIIIGGGIEKAGSLFMDSLRKTVKEWAFEEATYILKIVPAQLAENAMPIGAASLVVKSFFEQA